MKEYTGIAASKGIAIGKIKWISYQKHTISERTISDVFFEKKRFDLALEYATQQLDLLYSQALEKSGEKVAEIFAAHKLIIEDAGFTNYVFNLIVNSKFCAEYAVYLTSKHFSESFENMDNEYLQSRSADIEDVSNRLINILSESADSSNKTLVEKLSDSGNIPELNSSLENAMTSIILITENLTPGDLIQICKGNIGLNSPEKSTTEFQATPVLTRPENPTPECQVAATSTLQENSITACQTDSLTKEGNQILAFATVRGSSNSHTSIVAKSMGIPAVVNVSDLAEEVDNKVGIIDGYEGKLIADPDTETINYYLEKMDKIAEETKQLLKIKDMENVTKSGKKIELCANIENPSDLPNVINSNAGGIGLFRSEFLFLEAADFPDEDYQYEIYRNILETMENRKTVIRTFDIGADKKPVYFDVNKEANKEANKEVNKEVNKTANKEFNKAENHEENPALGIRAVRFYLRKPEIFKTQLRALYRASVYGNLSIMYPMIISVDELIKIKEISKSVREELTKEGYKIGEVKEGIMIETPAAALISDELARYVDFFSIGTNDLTQYTLAVDRQNAELEGIYDQHHPAVFKLIELVTQNAHRNGIEVCICGELAADRKLTQKFINMGIDELSVSIADILPLRQEVLESE